MVKDSTNMAAMGTCQFVTPPSILRLNSFPYVLINGVACASEFGESECNGS